MTDLESAVPERTIDFVEAWNVTISVRSADKMIVAQSAALVITPDIGVAAAVTIKHTEVPEGHHATVDQVNRVQCPVMTVKFSKGH